MKNRKAIYESQLHKARTQFILLSENDREWYDYALNRETETDRLDSVLDKSEMGAAVVGLGGTLLGAATAPTGVGALVGTGIELGADAVDVVNALARTGQAAYYSTIENNPEKAKESLAMAGVNALASIPLFGNAVGVGKIGRAAYKALAAADNAADAARAMTKGERVAKTAQAASQAAEVATDATKVAKGVEKGKELAVIPKTEKSLVRTSDAGKALTKTADLGRLAKSADAGKTLAKSSKLGRLARLGAGGALATLAGSALLNTLTGPREGLSTDELRELEKNPNLYSDMKLGSLGVGQFDPGEATKSVSSIRPQERGGKSSRFNAPAMGIFDPDDPNYYRRSSRALSQGLTENMNVNLYKKIKHNINSYLKSKEGQELNSHIEKIKQEIDI